MTPASTPNPRSLIRFPAPSIVRSTDLWIRLKTALTRKGIQTSKKLKICRKVGPFILACAPSQYYCVVENIQQPKVAIKNSRKNSQKTGKHTY